MGSLKSSKYLALLVGKTNNVQGKGKDKRDSEFEPKEDLDPSYGASGSKKDKHKRFEKTKFTYCKKGNHPQNLCMKKNIYQMNKFLEKNYISLLKGTRNTDFGIKIDDHERFHALKD